MRRALNYTCVHNIKLLIGPFLLLIFNNIYWIAMTRGLDISCRIRYHISRPFWSVSAWVCRSDTILRKKNQRTPEKHHTWYYKQKKRQSLSVSNITNGLRLWRDFHLVFLETSSPNGPGERDRGYQYTKEISWFINNPTDYRMVNWKESWIGAEMTY